MLPLLTAAVLATQAANAEPTISVLQGSVLEANGGPVPRACIEVIFTGERGFAAAGVGPPDCTIRADEGGRFRLHVERGPMVVGATRNKEHGPLRFAPVTWSASGGRAEVRFDGTASIRGRAIDERGLPVANAKVTARPEVTRPDAVRGDAIVSWAMTSEDGSFVVTGLKQGAHRLAARGEGLACVEACEYRTGMQANTGPVPVNLVLSVIGQVTGRVLRVDAKGRSVPVQAFEVESPAFGAIPFEGGDGRFEIDVTRLWKGAELYVSAPGFAPFATRFYLLEPARLDFGDIVLREGRSVRGRVTDGSGRPLQGAVLNLGFAKYPLRQPKATTDSAGRFVISGVPGPVVPLTVSHPDHRPVDVEVADATEEVEIVLQEGVALPVRVLDLDGSPIEGAEVWTVVDAARCVTNAQGRCVLAGLERKEQIIEVLLRRVPRPEPQQLRVPSGGARPAEVTLRYPRKPSQLSVVVVDADGRAADAQVFVLPGEAAAPALDGRDVPVVPYYAAGIDLVKTYDNLPPQRYTVVAKSQVGMPRCASVIVELGEGEKRTLTVRLPRDSGRCAP